MAALTSLGLGLLIGGLAGGGTAAAIAAKKKSNAATQPADVTAPAPTASASTVTPPTPASTPSDAVVKARAALTKTKRRAIGADGSPLPRVSAIGTATAVTQPKTLLGY